MTPLLYSVYNGRHHYHHHHRRRHHFIIIIICSLKLVEIIKSNVSLFYIACQPFLIA